MRRQPAEWEPHAACWTAWPADAELWPGVMARAQAAVAAMCRALAPGERVRLLVADGDADAAAAAALGDAPVERVVVPYGDIWLRDTGPVFVSGPEGVSAVRFGFNGWGERFVYPHDDTVGDAVVEAAGVPVRRFDWVLEGGAVEPDGAGTALVTRQCLCHPNRARPGEAAAGEAAWAARLEEALGIERLVWLDEGLAADHTDGHVDNIARFVGPGRVLCMRPNGADDPNAAVLAGIERALRAAGLEVETTPSPGRILDQAGDLMPASYVNFYVGNGAVVVPAYGVEGDSAAVATLQRLFPDRRVVGVDAWAVLHGGGAFHCITQQQPAAREVGR